MVIPAHLVEEVANEAVRMTIFEEFVMEKVLEGRSVIGLYPPTLERTAAEFETWRAKNAI